MKLELHKYQERAVEFLLQRACGGLFLSPGLGKTCTTLMTYNILRNKQLSRKVLVLAPLRVVYSVWGAEVAKWDELQHLSVGILHGPNKDKVLAEEHDIYVMNYEGLQWLEQATKRNMPFDMLVVDESSKVKNTSTRRFKMLKKMIGKFSRKYILTGSPVANGLLDLFGQIYVMDQGATFGAYVSQYKNEYFYQSGFGGYEWLLKPGADQLIYSKLEGKVLRLKAEDYLDMPDLIKTNIVVDLDKDAKLVYLTMEKKLQAEFEAGKVIAANAGVAAMKCRQIASGSVYADDGTVHHVHSAKIDALADLIDELEGEPLLVGYEFKHEVESIHKALGKHIPNIGGGISAKSAAVLIDAWNRKEIPVLLAQSSSLAHGVNLQAGGHHLCWFTPTYNLETYEQFIARIYRQGQPEHVFIYHIVAKGTIDYAVMAAVNKKDNTQQSFLAALGNYWPK